MILTDSQGLGTIQNDDSASLTINDVTMAEGNAGATLFTFDVTLDAEVDTDVMIDFATFDGTATVADNDYRVSSGTGLTFAANSGGASVRQIMVTVNGDQKVELDETFELVLFNVQAGGLNVTFADDRGLGTIINDDSANLTIGDVTQDEGDGAATVFTFDVTLDADVDTDVTIDFATADGSALLADNDYLISSGTTLTFNGNSGGASTRQITVTVNGDTKVELDETFFVNLSNLLANSRAVTLVDSQGLGTIINDDSASLTINDVTVDEGDSGTTTFTFDVTLDAEVDADVTIDFETTDGIALLADNDYVMSSGTALTFSANSGGSSTRQITVTVNGDTKVERDETFFVNLSNLLANGREVTLGDTQGVGVIQNDDGAEITISDVSATAEGDSGTTNFTFDVTLNGTVDVPVFVNFATADGTAIAGQDYTAQANALGFLASGNGDQTLTVTVAVAGDETVELDEEFFVNLSSLMASGRDVTITKPQGVGTIRNDDSASIRVGDPVITEGDSGTTSLTFAVTLDGRTDVPVTVDYATADGTATSGQDYSAASGTLTFAAGVDAPQTLFVTVDIFGDLTVERDETFFLNLNPATLSTTGRDVTIPDPQGQATITNDEVATISIDDVTVVEGDSGTVSASFTVTLDADVDTSFTIDYATEDVSAAVGDNDYVAASGQLSFVGSAGETKTITVIVNGDQTVELDEIFLVALSGIQSSGRAVDFRNSDFQAIGTIRNDDIAALSIEDITVTEGDAGTVSAVFTVTLDKAADSGFTVDFATANSTAASGDDDFEASIGRLSFTGAAGETQTITIMVNGDNKVELDELFHVNLSNIVGSGRAVVFKDGDSQAVATIQNDDFATLSIDDVTQTEGDSGDTVFNFTVTLDNDVDTSLTVDVDTSDQTTNFLDDYIPNTGSLLNFVGQAGEQQTFSVIVRGDTRIEQDETFLTTLSRIVAGGRDVRLGTAQGIGTIINDDMAAITISDVTIAEGDSGTQNAVFTVTLDSEVDSDVLVDYTTTAITASAADGDYTAQTGTVTFAANFGGPQILTVSVPIVGDSKVEMDESFALDLTLASAAGDVEISDARGVATITNDDSATIRILDLALMEGNSGTTTFAFNVELDAEVDAALTLNYVNTAGTATVADGDYTMATGTSLTFAANSGGPQTQVIHVVVAGDARVELDETFMVSLSNLMTSGLDVTLADSDAVGTILNDDQANLSINDVSVAEGDSGTVEVTFTITLDAPVDHDVAVNFGTAAGTAATGDADYVSSLSNSVTFAANSGGAQTHEFTVLVNGDEKVERDETFFANLSGLMAGGRNVIISDRQGAATIVNDDHATIAISDVTMAEGAAGNTIFNFVVTLDAEVDIPLSLSAATAPDTATAADGDYVAFTGRNMTFAANAGPGAQTRTVAVTVLGDTRLEQDETFLVNLLNLTTVGRSVTLSDGEAVGTITNDDEATLTVADAQVLEGQTGTRNLVFNVTLNAEVTGDVTVSYLVSNGTATAGFDYSAVVPGTLTFNGGPGTGVQTRTITVPILGDRVVELDETVMVTLSGVVDGGQGVTIADGAGVGTIVNDDTATLSINDVTVQEGDTTAGNVMTFTVTLDRQVDAGLTVAYEVVDGTATVAGGDYQPDPIVPLVFTGSAGETRTVRLQTRGDLVAERNETLLVNLLTVNANGRNVVSGKASGTGTITNDDMAELRISDVAVIEGSSGTRQAVFTVSLAGAVDVPVGLTYTTVDGTASASSGDYAATSGTVTLPGTANSSATISVPVTGDTQVEPDEIFFVDLSGLNTSGRDVVVTDSRGQGIITNDDFVNISVADVSIAEGYQATGTTLTFTVTRSNNSIPTTVTYATADGTATIADNDYVAASGTLMMAAGGPLTQTVTVNVVGDHRVELSETVLLNIASTSTGANVLTPQATGTIQQDDGTITGRKWHDRNGNGLQDVGEPGLSGWVIQLLDSAGAVVTSTVTGTDGQYSLPANQGTWNLQEVMQNGWRQTFPDGGNALAYSIDQQYGLRFTGNIFLDWGGLGEKWLRGDDGWFFITPAGNLFKWDNSPRTALTGDLIAALGSRFHTTPSLLYNAEDASARAVTVAAGQTVAGIDFGNIPSGLIQGRKWHDINADGVHDAVEPWLSGWTMTLTDSQGNVVGTAVTGDLDLNQDGSIDPATETGWYRFSSLLPGTYSVSEESRQGWSPSGAEGAFAAEAYRLDQERGFLEPSNDFLNWGGRNERWLYGKDGYYFITPDGSLYKWNRSPRTALTGQLVATLDASYWADLSLLYHARRPATQEVVITGQEVSDVHFANTFGHNGAGTGNVTAVVTNGNLVVTGDSQANTIVIHLSPSGVLYVSGVDGTTVNGQSVPFAATTTGSSGVRLSSVNLGGGNDQLLVSADASAGATGGSSALNIESGAGNDMVVVSQISGNRNLTIANSGGHDVRRVQSSRLNNVTLTGGGSSALEDSEVVGNLSATRASVGTTVIRESEIGGATTLNGSADSDSILAWNSVFNGAFQASGQNGNDVIALLASDFMSAVTVDGGPGNDTVGLRFGNNFRSSASLSGGDGADTFASDGNSVGTVPQRTSLETDNNSILNNLIDLALSSFEDLMLDS
ncbi:MAG: Calx-beta domain-containing protein [Planctomycetaceae bacterium]